ncbi:MAG: efflux RND transporter permease subunit, partial [Pannonibacter indicus]
MSSSHKPDRSFTALFVRRPVLAFVMNMLIVVAGLAAFFGVEVRELPDVDQPVISIRTTYNSASAETIDREVTGVIEGAVSRVSGVKSISSSSSYGESRVTVEFYANVNLDAAAADMRDALGRITNNLPEDADAARIIKADSNAQPVVRLALTSDSMSVEDMTVLVEDEVADVLSAVPGVADVQVSGDREKIFRIDIDQARMASLNLTVGDVASALSTMAFDTPAGSLTSQTQDLIVRASAAIDTPEAFESIILNRRARLGDFATVTLGPDIGQSQLRANGKSGIGLGIIRAAQSNTLEISQGVAAAAERIQQTLPEGTKIEVTSDDATFITGSIHEVEIALMISVSVVLLIIFLFLRDWRATLIPAVTMPVALIGTLAAIYLAGFSINILTLLALVLATGLVVDDAIVVLENIVRRRNQGMGPRAAAVLGTDEVFFAVIATTATLAAVFVPLSFLPGQTGGLFREFGFVLAIAVLLSSVVALSLCPMLASHLLKGKVANMGADETVILETEARDDAGAPQAAVPARQAARQADSGLASLYRRTLRACLDAPMVVLAVSLLFAMSAVVLFGTIKSELTPSEDRSMAFMRISAPQGVSLDYLAEQMTRVEELIQPLRDSGEITSTFSVAGQGGRSNNGFMVMRLAPWEARTRSQQEIVADVSRLVRDVPGVRAFVFQPNSLGIRGAGSGLQFAVAGSNYAALGESAAKIVAELEKDPRFTQPRLSTEATQPQLSVSIDRERASDLGIDINGLGNAMQAMLDGRRVGQVFIEDRSFDVKFVSTTNPINDPTDLENVFLRTGDGRFVPVSTIATLTEKAVPPQLDREQQLRSVAITSSLAPDFALGDAYKVAQEIAAPLLPPGGRIVPLAEAATLGEQSASMARTFGFALLIILLVL